MSARWFKNKARGNKAEDAWERHLQSKGWDVISATLEQDKRGMDRFALKDGRIVIFDVKCDGVARVTGNIGLELYDEYADGRTRDGWARKSVVDWIVFACEMGDEYDIHLIKADEILRKLSKLEDVYETKPTAKNRDGKKVTHNLLVPINDLPDVFESYQYGGRIR